MFFCLCTYVYIEERVNGTCLYPNICMRKYNNKYIG